MVAAVVAAFKPAEILALVSASFSLAASAFFPGMVLGMLWPRVHRPAVVMGMLSGLGVTIFYMLINAPGFRHFWGMDPFGGLWWGIQPLSAGVFGVPVGFGVMLLATWLTWVMAFSEAANAWWGTLQPLSIAASQAGATGGEPWQELVLKLTHIGAGLGLIIAWSLLVIGFIKQASSTTAKEA
jgi:Na+/proline symporter